MSDLYNASSIWFAYICHAKQSIGGSVEKI